MHKNMLKRLLDVPKTSYRLLEEIRIAKDINQAFTEEEEKIIREIAADLDKAYVVTEKEQARLRSLYPLFEFTFQAEKEGGGGSYTLKNKSRSHWVANFTRAGHELEARADNEHMSEAIAESFMAQYTALYISAWPNRSGIHLSTYVKREDGSDGTAISGDLNLTDPELHDKLSARNLEAALSLLDDTFFCTGHAKAEPKENYGYFYFAGHYCKQYGEENPDHRRAALAERYN